MSFHLNDQHHLEAVGGAARRKHERLLREAHGAQHDSPAARALIEFQRAWINDHDAVIAQAEAEENPPKPKKRKADIEPIEIEETGPGTD